MSAAAKGVFPLPGDISPDRVAIQGTMGFTDLFMGSNEYYLRYWQPPDHGLIASLVDWNVWFRSEALGVAEGVFAMYVPNKASCLPDNYPLQLPAGVTPVYAGLREVLSPYTGNCFFPWMTEGTFEDRAVHWFRHDSHWTSLAAQRAASWVLESLGVLPDFNVLQRGEDYYGDLCGRWNPANAMVEPVVHAELSDVRECVSDNARGDIHSGHVGRFVTWKGPSTAVQRQVLIVGDSFAGAGYSPWNLTYWLSHCFAQTTFLHSYHVPDGLLTALRPDFVVYQSNERFMTHTPLRGQALDPMLEAFADRQSGLGAS